MADLTAFSSSAFNSSAWINAALKDTPEDESLEAYISTLTTKLHIMSQDYTDQLETAMVESMSTMPRILSEITKTEDQLRSIEAEMKSLSQQLNSFDQRNVAGVEDLSRLDTLKTNMERCKATLEEHARWSQLVREAKIIMEGGGRLSDSADKIETMYKSLAILKNLPGNIEREETCETFKNSLLTALRPIVRRDVAGLDTTPLQEYLYVFKKLGREQELEEEYVRARPDRIKSVWMEYNSAKHPDFPKWLATFLGKVARLLADEEASTVTLFGVDKSPSVLCDILIEALRPLTAGLSERLASLRAPEAAFDTYCVMEEFARRMLSYVQKVDEAKQAQVLDAMYSGFVTFLPQYAEMETTAVRAHLVRLLDAIALSTRESASEQKPKGGKKGSTTASLDDELFGEEGDAADAYGVYGEKILYSTEHFIQPLEHSLKRAVRFAGGMQIKHIVRLLSTTLALFVKHLVLKIDDLSVASGFPRDQVLALANGGLYNEHTDLDKTSTKGAAKLQQEQAVAERFAQQLELSDVDSRVLITSALRALQSIGRLSKNFLSLETLTRNLLIELQQSVFVGRAAGSVLALGSSPNPSNTTSLGSVYSMQVLQKDPNSLSELKSFLVAASASASQVSQAPFAAVSVVLKKLRGAAGQLLFGLCLEAPEKMLGTFAQEDAWTLTSEKGVDREELREHMLPQSVVTQVGEHLLSLVQELEAFASSDALADILRVRGQARALANTSSGWQALKKLLQITDDDILSGLSAKSKCAPLIATIETTLLGSEAAAQVLAERPDYTTEEYEVEAVAPMSPVPGATGLASNPSNASLSDTPSTSGSVTETNDTELDSTAVLKFVNEWLGAIADATVGLLLGQVAHVPALSMAGCAQLITDLEYLSNVINATGIKPHPLLSHVRVILEQDPASLNKAIELLPHKTKGAVGFLIQFDHMLVTAIAKGAHN